MLPACGTSISMLLAVYLGIFPTIIPSPIVPGLLRMAIPLISHPTVNHSQWCISGASNTMADTPQIIVFVTSEPPDFISQNALDLVNLSYQWHFLKQCMPHDTVMADWDCSLDATVNIRDLHASPYCKVSSVTFWFCSLCFDPQVLSVCICWGT